MRASNRQVCTPKFRFLTSSLERWRVNEAANDTRAPDPIKASYVLVLYIFINGVVLIWNAWGASEQKKKSPAVPNYLLKPQVLLSGCEGRSGCFPAGLFQLFQVILQQKKKQKKQAALERNALPVPLIKTNRHFRGQLSLIPLSQSRCLKYSATHFS